MQPRQFSLLSIHVLGLAAVAMMVSAQEKSVAPGINQNFADPKLDVAQWTERFEKEGREIFDHRARIVDACELKPGLTVADVGAGSGLFTRLFAAKVGPTGRVIAADIAERFLKKIEADCRQAGLSNVTTVQCTIDDSRLAPDSVDVVFLCDTYHHLEFPQKTMASIQRALRTGGRLIIVDFKRIEGVSSDFILQHVRAGQEEFTREITGCGFRLIDTQDFLQENYILRFQK